MNNMTMKFVAVALSSTMFAGVAQAETVAWYRFDEKDPGFHFTSIDTSIIKNEVHLDEINTPCEVSASGPTIGDLNWADYYPTYTNTFCGKYTYDPVSGSRQVNKAAMEFKTGPKNDGTVCNYGGLVRVKNLADKAKPTGAITVECFVRTKGGSFNTFANIACLRRTSSWTKETWALYLQKNGKLAVRLSIGDEAKVLYEDNKYDGASTTPSHTINDGVWHHIALTYDAATGVLCTYVDYVLDMKKTYTSATITYDTTSTDANYKAMYIGGSASWDKTNGGRNFTGAVDELRISDVVLQTSQFLRLQEEESEDVAVRVVTPAKVDGASNVGKSTYYRAFGTSDSGGKIGYESERYAAGIRADMYQEMVTNETAIHFTTNGAGKGQYVKLSSLTSRLFGNTNSSFTVETFFKAAGIVGGGNAGRQTIFKIGASPTAQIMFDAGSGRLMRYGCNSNGSWKGDTTDAAKLDDGKWHHAAFVYDYGMRQVRVYFDYKLNKCVNDITIKMDSNSSLFLGASHDSTQYFNGWIDDARVTCRALRPYEFLCATAEKIDPENPTLLHAAYDNSLVTSPYSETFGEGTAEKQGKDIGSLPTYGRAHYNNFLLGGSNSTERTANLASIVSTSSRWGWKYSPITERESFTVEFFGKFTELTGNATLVRYSGNEQLYENAPWMFYSPGDDGNSHRMNLQFATCLITNGVSRTDYSTWIKMPWRVNDGKWHHYAFAYRPHEGTNTAVTLWGDYKEIKTLILKGQLDYAAYKGGRLGMGGSGTAATHFSGMVDNFRYSAGVLDPSQFIYRAADPLVILVR